METVSEKSVSERTASEKLESEENAGGENREMKSPTGQLKSLEKSLKSDQKHAAGTAKKPALRSNLVPALGLLIAGAAGFYFWSQAGKVEETDDAFITGRVHQLSSRVSGTVISVNVDDNDHVKAGQLLVKIDPADLQLAAASAKAAAAKASYQAAEAASSIVANSRSAAASDMDAASAIAAARAQVDRAKAALAETKLGVKLAATTIAQRQAELRMTQADYERYESLLVDRAVTRQSFDKARQDKEVAAANLQAAIEQEKQSRVRVEEATQAVADAQANVVKARGAAHTAAAADAQTEKSKVTLSVEEANAKQAEAEYENAVKQLSYTNIVAPVTGKVGHRTVEVGNQVERGQALMSVVSDDKWVVANFKETQLARMKPGQEVEIKIDAFPGKKFSGHVDSMSPASGAQFALLPPDNATGNFTKVVQRIQVKITFDKESIKGYEDLIAPGMSVIPAVKVAE